MEPARIAALLEPFLDRELSSSQLQQISTYIDLLVRWNARINLTAIRQPEEIVTRHFGESFFLARHLFPSPASPLVDMPSLDFLKAPGAHVLDIGSGAGFPALPLKIWAPEIRLTLIESNHKKATFLREAARALTLTDINVLTDRAEVLAARPDFPRTQAVTFRAVEKFDQILPIAATLLSTPACLAILIGSTQLPKLSSLPAFQWQTFPIPASTAKVLSVGIKP